MPLEGREGGVAVAEDGLAEHFETVVWWVWGAVLDRLEKRRKKEDKRM